MPATWISTVAALWPYSREGHALIGARMSEPHTSKSNRKYFIYIHDCVYICHSLKASLYTLSTITTCHVRTKLRRRRHKRLSVIATWVFHTHSDFPLLFVKVGTRHDKPEVQQEAVSACQYLYTGEVLARWFTTLLAPAHSQCSTLFPVAHPHPFCITAIQ